MPYKYQSRRSAKRLARKSKRNFIITLILIALLVYFTFTWMLPSFIGGVGFIKGIVKPSQKTSINLVENITLAPPVLNIPYEATNTAQIDIKGYGTPNSKVKLYLDDEAKQTVSVLEDGSFTMQNITLSLGTNNIYGKTIDDQEKESLPSKTIKLNFDNEKPPLSINEPEDGKIIQGGDKKVEVSGKTDLGIQILINGSQIIVDKDGNFRTDQSLDEGDNIITIKALDLASNSTEVQKKVIYKP